MPGMVHVILVNIVAVAALWGGIMAAYIYESWLIFIISISVSLSIAKSLKFFGRLISMPKKQM